MPNLTKYELPLDNTVIESIGKIIEGPYFKVFICAPQKEVNVNQSERADIPNSSLVILVSTIDIGAELEEISQELDIPEKLKIHKDCQGEGVVFEGLVGLNFIYTLPIEEVTILDEDDQQSLSIGDKLDVLQDELTKPDRLSVFREKTNLQNMIFSLAPLLWRKYVPNIITNN